MVFKQIQVNVFKQHIIFLNLFVVCFVLFCNVPRFLFLFLLKLLLILTCFLRELVSTFWNVLVCFELFFVFCLVAIEFLALFVVFVCLFVCCCVFSLL